MTKPSPSLVQAILGSGAIVGVMDGVAASVYSYLLRGGTPAGVFRYVASGVFGKDASCPGPSPIDHRHGHHDPDLHVRHRGTDRLLGGTLLRQMSAGP